MAGPAASNSRGDGRPPSRRTFLAAAALPPRSARDVTQAESATSALATALGNGQLDPTAFNAAVNRITNLRSSLF